jgi:hypothetical protein
VGFATGSTFSRGINMHVEAAHTRTTACGLNKQTLRARFHSDRVHALTSV